jgi:hypothetical protein
MDERFPDIRVKLPQQQAFDGAAARNPLPEQPGGKDARIVEDEQISARQVATELAEHRVVDSAVAVKDKHPRCAALFRRKLRDQFFGQVEIKICYVHQCRFRDPDARLAVALQVSSACSTSSLSAAVPRV